MNKKQKKALESVVNILEEKRDYLVEVLGVEEEKRENLSENFYDSEMYSKFEETCDNLEDIISDFDDVIDRLREEIIEY